MKSYPYIVIDKTNMSKIVHFNYAHNVADLIFDKQNKIPDRFIIVKNEKEIVDLESLRHITALPIIFHRKLMEIL